VNRKKIKKSCHCEPPAAYGIRLKNERIKYHTWENHPSVRRDNLIVLFLPTQHLNISTTQHLYIKYFHPLLVIRVLAWHGHLYQKGVRRGIVSK